VQWQIQKRDAVGHPPPSTTDGYDL